MVRSVKPCCSIDLTLQQPRRFLLPSSPHRCRIPVAVVLGDLMTAQELSLAQQGLEEHGICGVRI